MANLQVQARALGDPTRHKVFRAIVDGDAPLDVAHLTAEFGLNHNAIRQHLAKLVAADLVEETVAAPSGRGRPRLQYTVAPGAESRWGVTGPYERLSMWLAEAITSKETPVELGRRVGREGYRAAGASSSPIEEMVAQMSRQGFRPVGAQRRRGRRDRAGGVPLRLGGAGRPGHGVRRTPGAGGGRSRGDRGYRGGVALPPRPPHRPLRAALPGGQPGLSLRGSGQFDPLTASVSVGTGGVHS
ncbi:MAG: helix-turn-helix domain-containing protein [Candidatus Microthrix sp.]|uniref:Helix-turn-helix domain-containing protein n=1 Tax=Candidatus Neomicrothrix subdominans TaxID=2954438 RepID=A0A936TFP5_9ACTN|nr:helix-turn-helix domain-containing protein [Candidatus Microthrix subdominans]